MATANLRADSASANLTIGDIRRAASALRRLNEIDAAPILTAEDRSEIRHAKAACWSVVASAAEALVAVLDATAGDPDLEDATNVEDEEIEPHLKLDAGPGCDVADEGDIAWTQRLDQTVDPLPQSSAHFQSHEDAEEDDFREDDTPCEVETWEHWLDHPPELHIGIRPGHNHKQPKPNA